MSVKVNFLGRLGNHLFQYSLGRIIAEHRGFELDCRAKLAPGSYGEMPHFVYPATSETQLAHFPNASLYIPGIRDKSLVEPLLLGITPQGGGNTIDMKSLLQDQTTRQIWLSGYFQRYEYFEPYCDHIKDWFHFEDQAITMDVCAKDVVVNIRRGVDFGLHDWILPCSYYDSVLSNLTDVRRIFVCGTGINDQLREYLQKYEPTYYLGSPKQHFSFIKRFSRIIMSNSTFCWWAAFLSDASELYAPRSTNGRIYAFSGFSDVDLNMRQSRYKEVDVSYTDKLGLSAKDQECLTSLRWIKNGAVVCFRNKQDIYVKSSPGDREFITWLLSQKGIRTLSDMKNHKITSDLKILLAHLIDVELLKIEPEYLRDNSSS